MALQRNLLPTTVKYATLASHKVQTSYMDKLLIHLTHYPILAKLLIPSTKAEILLLAMASRFPVPMSKRAMPSLTWDPIASLAQTSKAF